MFSKIYVCSVPSEFQADTSILILAMKSIMVSGFGKAMENQQRSLIGTKENHVEGNTAPPFQPIRMTMADGLTSPVSGSLQAHCAR